VEEAAHGAAGAVPDERLVGARPVDEAPGERARGVIFRDQLVPVIDPPPPARALKLVEAGQRIVDERVARRCPRYRYFKCRVIAIFPGLPQPFLIPSAHK
jgi:hypothetical protein